MKGLSWLRCIARWKLPGRWEPRGWHLSLAGLVIAITATWVADLVIHQQPPSVHAVPTVILPPSPLTSQSKLRVGTQVPDFALPSVQDEHLVRLSTFQGRPLVVVFGSLSCDLFCNRLEGLENLRQAYAKRAAFLWVYIKEAGHPVPGFEFVLREAAPGKPGAIERHRQAIRRALARRTIAFPCVLDQDDGTVERQFAAWPLRLLVLDGNRRVAVDLGHGFGPGKWDLSAIETWLKAQPASGPAVRSRVETYFPRGTVVRKTSDSRAQALFIGFGIRYAHLRQSGDCPRARFRSLATEQVDVRTGDHPGFPGADPPERRF